MTSQMLYGKFKKVFGYLADHAVQYKTINSDPHSIRITMQDGTVYIFTYPANGHYTLVTENVGVHVRKELEKV